MQNDLRLSRLTLTLRLDIYSSDLMIKSMLSLPHFNSLGRKLWTEGTTGSDAGVSGEPKNCHNLQGFCGIWPFVWWQLTFGGLNPSVSCCENLRRSKNSWIFVDHHKKSKTNQHVLFHFQKKSVECLRRWVLAMATCWTPWAPREAPKTCDGCRPPNRRLLEIGCAGRLKIRDKSSWFLFCGSLKTSSFHMFFFFSGILKKTNDFKPQKRGFLQVSEHKDSVAQFLEKFLWCWSVI